jgi:hypothetical protein
MTALETGADPALTRLADAILIPPFPGRSAPRWILEALGRGLAGVTLFGQNISTPEQVNALTASAARRPACFRAGDRDRRGGRRRHPGRVRRTAARTRATPRSARWTTYRRDRAVYRAIGADLAALGDQLRPGAVR